MADASNRDVTTLLNEIESGDGITEKFQHLNALIQLITAHPEQFQPAVVSQLTKLIASDDTPTRLRLVAVKGLQRILLVLTDDHKLSQLLGSGDHASRKAEFVSEAGKLVQELATATKTQLGRETPGPLGLVCVNVASSIALQRPNFMGRLLPPLLAAAAIEGKEVSISNALSNGLSPLLHSNHAMCKPWKSKIRKALRIEEDSTAAAQQEDTRETKRRRMDEAAAEIRAASTQAIPSDEASRTAAATSLISNTYALLDSGNAHALAGYLSGTDPAVLADAVIHCMVQNFHTAATTQQYQPPHHVACIQQMLPLLDRQTYLPDPIGYSVLLSSSLAAIKQAEEAAKRAVGMDIDGQKQQEQEEQEDELIFATGPREVPYALDIRNPPLPLEPEIAEKAKVDAISRTVQSLLPSPLGDSLYHMLPVRLLSLLPVDAQLLEKFPGLVQDGGDVALTWLNELYVQHQINNKAAVVQGGEENNNSNDEDEEMTDANNNTNKERNRSIYASALVLVLQGIHQKLPSTNRTLIKVLSEAPDLPLHDVENFLVQLSAAGSDWGTLALLGAQEILLHRPKARKLILKFVLRVAVSGDVELRSKAVRLVANRLFTFPAFKGDIVEFASDQLAALSTEEALQDRYHKYSEYIETASIKADKQLELQANNDDDKKESTSDIELSRAIAVCSLYCALCTKDDSLLMKLFDMYAQCTASGRSAIMQNAEAIAKAIKPISKSVLHVMSELPDGSLDLLLELLNVFATESYFPAPLVTACIQVFDKTNDPRVLVPALHSVDQNTILKKLLLPLLDLPQDILKTAFHRLLVPPSWAQAEGETQGAFSPTELLVALHTLDQLTELDNLKKAIQGINVCLASPELFTPESIAASINQLLTRVPLPALFMRTVIQTLAAAPHLKTFVVGVLGQLLSKQIWRDTNQFKGWVMCAKQLVPDSYGLLTQLPASVLKDTVLVQLSDEVKEGVREFARTHNFVPQDIRAALNG